MQNKKEMAQQLLSKILSISYGSATHILNDKQMTTKELSCHESILTFFSATMNAKSHVMSMKKVFPIHINCQQDSPVASIDESVDIIPSEIMMIGYDTALELSDNICCEDNTCDWSQTIADWNDFQSHYKEEVFKYTLLSAAITETMIESMSLISDELADLSTQEQINRDNTIKQTQALSH